MAKKKKPASKLVVMTPADAMRSHAETMMRIPAGEQFIGHIQTVIAAALNDLARWMDGIDKGGISRNVVRPASETKESGQ